MPKNKDAAAYAALACVCFFWGTTYLGIRMALESFPPAALVALRFSLSGAILLLYAFARGHRLPEARELLRTVLLGVLILGIGNGSISWAELLIPSGLASLFITISPFYLVGIEALMPRGEKLHWPTIAGMAVGFLGAALLITPDLNGHTGGLRTFFGFLVTQLGVAAWCSGSILQKQAPNTASPVMTLGIQQAAAGLAFVPFAILLPHQPAIWNARGVGAILYLVVFGSLVGYTAYLYALRALPVAIFSVYPYFNAVVAVALGWLFYREHFGWKEAIAMAIIFAGVAIVKWQTGRAAGAKRPLAEAALAHGRD